MAVNMKDYIASLPEERQRRIREGAAKLRAEYLAVQDMRKAMKLTQQQLAEKMNMDQGNLSRLEKQSDMMISTLRHYVEAVGGKLSIIAQFPDRPPVELAGFSDMDE